MRLATFNILHGRAPSDGRVDLDRFAGAVRALDADVLALQEVDRSQPRSGGADLTAVAAQAGGYREHRFVAALSGLPDVWQPAEQGDPAEGPAYGVALLSRVPVRSWRTVRLPALPGRVPVVFRGTGRLQLVSDEPRVAAVAELDVSGAPLTVVSTHLSFLPGWNLHQLRRLVRDLAGEERLVVAGDLNMQAPLARATSGLRPLATGRTFPADAPVRQLDHVLARGAVSGDDGKVWQAPLSDHRALSVQLTA